MLHSEGTRHNMKECNMELESIGTYTTLYLSPQKVRPCDSGLLPAIKFRWRQTPPYDDWQFRYDDAQSGVSVRIGFVVDSQGILLVSIADILSALGIKSPQKMMEKQLLPTMRQDRYRTGANLYSRYVQPLTNSVKLPPVDELSLRGIMHPDSRATVFITQNDAIRIIKMYRIGKTFSNNARHSTVKGKDLRTRQEKADMLVVWLKRVARPTILMSPLYCLRETFFQM